MYREIESVLMVLVLDHAWCQAAAGASDSIAVIQTQSE
jgi:hypothetical protein